MLERTETIRMSAGTKKYLQDHAKKNHRTFAATCRLALEEWIEHDKKMEEKRQ